MAHHRKAKYRALRPPFLITVATLAGALLPACGGNTTTVESTGGSAGSGGSTSSSTGAGGGNNADCPVTQPVAGSGCATAGLRCKYPYCGYSLEMSCNGTTWANESFGSCNPPPPVAPCPPSEPVVGTGCYLDPTSPATICSYPHPELCCGAPSPDRQFACPSGGWQKLENDAGACAPAPPSCPAALPAEGAPCCFNAPLPSGGCRYTPCGLYWMDNVTCDANKWHIVHATCNPPPPPWDAGPD